MNQRLLFLLLLFVLCCTQLTASVVIVFAQDAQCGSVDAIDFPADPSVFQIAQGFGAPSPRHHGRYHTGEDWFGGADAFGQPVRAIARGRVTYSSATVWGRDGGVVIIEHMMPDGTTMYSMYGHMVERGDITFPSRFACVQLGDIVGAVGDVRPAPHFHWEIRTSGADLPGAGYEWEDPRVIDYREPSAFVTDWQARLGTASLWFVEFADDPVAPPLVLDDNSLLMLNGAFLRRVLPDGRILWRVTLEQAAVGVVGFEGAPLLVLADGIMQRVDYDGNLGESWQIESRFDSPPIETPDAYLLHTPDNALVAVDRRWRAVLWQLDDIPLFRRSYTTGGMIALLTHDHTLLFISTAGQVIGQATLRDVASFATGTQGSMLAYTRGGVWNIDNAGTWALALPAAPQGTTARAVAVGGAITYLFDGAALYAYRDGQVLWQTAFAAEGAAVLSVVNDALLLTFTGGGVAAFSTESGGLCGALRLWHEDEGALLWHELGDDGALRVMIGRRVLGLDWEGFNDCS